MCVQCFHGRTLELVTRLYNLFAQDAKVCIKQCSAYYDTTDKEHVIMVFYTSGGI